MIQEAIECVLAQDYPSIEHIIIDGDSNDGTFNILKQYPHLKILTEPDNGMYDALNKGLGIANGEIIGFLNTDDYYIQGAFMQIVDLLAQSQADAVAGRADYVLEKKDHTSVIFRKSVWLSEQVFWREITYGAPAFNAWFFHRHVFDIVGKFDTDYRIAGDRDFLIRFALSKLKHIPFDKVVYRYRAHDDSLSMTQNLLGFSRMADENLRLVDRYMNVLPHNARADMERVRTRDTITAASRNLRGGAFKSAFHYAKLGCQKDLFWPVKFFFRIATGILRVVERKFGIYSQI
jgi:glycosyltransferase involved in cell wall biosynthesis